MPGTQAFIPVLFYIIVISNSEHTRRHFITMFCITYYIVYSLNFLNENNTNMMIVRVRNTILNVLGTHDPASPSRKPGAAASDDFRVIVSSSRTGT